VQPSVVPHSSLLTKRSTINSSLQPPPRGRRAVGLEGSGCRSPTRLFVEVPSTFLPTRGFVLRRWRPLSRWRIENGMLSRLALLVTEEGLMRLRSTEDVKDIIFHHFRIRKYELCVYHSRPDPFLVIFPDRHARDVVFEQDVL
jgi:hypothetical protein